MSRKIKILFLAANPHDRTRLELGREFGKVRDALQQSRYRAAFRLLEPEFNARIGNFTSALLKTRPDIVHFCGHGSESQGIVFEREDRYSRPADSRELTTLFEELHRNARLVFLNACHTKDQAQALGLMFDYTIGTNGRIEDRAAVDFAGWFYSALANGATVSGAFHAACSEAGERIGGLAELSKKEMADDARPFILQVLKPAAPVHAHPTGHEQQPQNKRQPATNAPAPVGHDSTVITLNDNAQAGTINFAKGSNVIRNSTRYLTRTGEGQEE